jgi:signal recognition particle GTPase
MAFEGLTEKISAAFKKLRGKGRIKEADVKEYGVTEKDILEYWQN